MSVQLASLAAFLCNLLFLALLYLIGRIVITLTVLSRRQSHALAGSTVPSLFAPPPPVLPPPSLAWQGGAALPGSQR